MGNCASSDAERSFAEQQRRRAANIVPGQPTSHGQQVDGYGRPMVQIPLSSPGPPGPPPQQRSPNAQNFPAAGPSPAPQPEPQNINTIRGDTKIGRKSGEVLVISYDLGTTGSGCAYAWRNANDQIVFGPEVIDSWPGQAAASMQSKTPSVLLYNKYGQCQVPWGAECLSDKFTPRVLEAQGLRMAEWYKLHIDPAKVPPEHFSSPNRQLPPGVTAWQMYSEYLRRLHTAAIARFASRRGMDLFQRLTQEDKVQYIITIPAAWQKPAFVGELRKCAVQAGMIHDEQSSAIDFCTEPEASALECFHVARSPNLGAGDIFTVVDAGGGTVDLTSYQVLSLTPVLTLKEVDVGTIRCLYRGATFVDRDFEEFLSHYLTSQYPFAFKDAHLARGVKDFKTTIKPQFSANNRELVHLTLTDDEDLYVNGAIQLTWEQIEACFKPHVDRIVEAAKGQQETSSGRSKVTFLCGGFGSNDYLFERMSQALPNTTILQPGDKTAGSKAVSLGAVRYALFRSVQSRTSPAWYGVKAFRTLMPGDMQIPRAAQHAAIGKSGKQILDQTFSVVLPFGDSVGDDEWRSSNFNIEISNDAPNARQGKLLLYESSEMMPPSFVDDPGVKFLCQVDVYIPPHSQGREMVATDGVTYRSYSVKVLLSLGRADLRSRAVIDGVEAGGATITWGK